MPLRILLCCASISRRSSIACDPAVYSPAPHVPLFPGDQDEGGDGGDHRTAPGAGPGDAAGGYAFKVHAYIVRAVNRLGVESGPSPYALTFPSAPRHVLVREVDGGTKVKWADNPEKAIAGYHVYRMTAANSRPKRLTDAPLKTTAFTDPRKGLARYFIVAVDSLGQEGEPSAPAWAGHRYPTFYEGDWHP